MTVGTNMIPLLAKISEMRKNGKITLQEAGRMMQKRLSSVPDLQVPPRPEKGQKPGREPEPLITIKASSIRKLLAVRRSRVEIPLRSLMGKKGGGQVSPSTTKRARARTPRRKPSR